MIENKENINGKYKTSKDSLTKLDLSKIMTCKDTNAPSTYSGHRSISNSNNYEMINYGNHYKNDTTTDSNLKLS